MNFQQFNLSSLCEEEKEMLVLNLSGKVEMNEKLNKMLNTEKLKVILETLEIKDSEIKKQIVSEIKNLDLLKIFSQIKKEDLEVYQIIKKYYSFLVKLLKIDFDLKITNKSIIIYIQNILMSEEYDIEDIQKIIKHIRQMYEMIPKAIEVIQENEYLVEEINVEDIKSSLKIQELIEEIIKELQIENELEDEETILYIRLYDITKILSVFKMALKINYNINNLFERLSEPYINNNPRIKSQNLIQVIINKIIQNRNITESLKIFTLNQITTFLINGETSYIEKLLTNNKIGDVIIFIQSVEKFNKLNNKNLNIMKKLLNNNKKERLSKMDFGLTEKCIDYMKDFTEYFTKSEIQLLLIEYKGLKNLKNIVELLMIGKQKLSKKSVKSVLKSTIVQKKYNDFNIFDVISDIQIPKMINTLHKSKNIKTDINKLKIERVQLSNMLKIIKEQESNDEEINNKIKDLDLKIKEYYINFAEDKMITENIDELIKYLQYLNKTTPNNTNEIERIQSMINNYSEKMKCYSDNYGTNYEEAKETKNVFGQFDNDLTKIINKYTNESQKEDKKQDKESFFKKQDRMIKQNILEILRVLDNKFNTNSKKFTDKLFNIYKKQLDTNIKKSIFKNIINKKLIKGKKNHALVSITLEISKIFTIIYYIKNNKNINVSKIYETMNIIDNEKNKGKLVLVKSLNKRGNYIQKLNNKVYVNVCEEVVCVPETDIEYLDTLVAKNVKIIKGPLKGLLGRVYIEKENTVLLTKDTFGMTISKWSTAKISTLPILKLPKDYIKIAEEQFENESETIYSNYTDLCKFSLLQNKQLYPLTKYLYINNYSSDKNNYNIFNELYELGLNVYNNMKLNELKEYEDVLKIKEDYSSNKKILKTLKNKGDTGKYILLRKILKNDERYIKSLLINLKRENITKSILKFEKIENHSSKYIVKHLIQKKFKKISKKQQKINNKISCIKLIEESKSQLEDLMKSLLLE